jgi:hypothetical protein
MRQGFHFRGIFDLRGMSQRPAMQKCGVLAGALTEMVCETYLDRVSAVEYANEAMRAFENALTRFEAKQYAPLPRDKTLDYILQALNAVGAMN